MTRPLSVKERVIPVPCLDRLFIAFLDTLHGGLSSFTMHRFALGGCLLQKIKARMLLITSKIFANVKGKVVELVTLVLGRFSINFRNLL